ncbi:MAG: hypothetical protein ACRC2K_06620 [Clostridium sp.]
MKKVKNNISSSQQTKDKTLKSSLIKTYGTIVILIISYFILTFSINSVDKKMDKLASSDTSIVLKQTINENQYFLSTNGSFFGLTRCTSLPLNRLSIKDSTSNISSQENIIIDSFFDNDINSIVIGGKSSNIKQIIFTDVAENNGSKSKKDVTIDVPNDEYFLISSQYSTSYENIRLIKYDNTIIEIN